ncbi:MAG: glycosyl hydrolase, partial [Planctomycetes bacterium]|nr:glycosyl hydrolase [Planctomycetota bacterium]
GLPAGEAIGRIGLAIAASRPDTIYATIDNQELLPEPDWDLGGTAVTAKRLRGMSKDEFLAQDPDEIERFIRGNDFPPDLDAEGLIAKIEKDELTIADLIAELDDANDNLFRTDIRGLEVYRSDDGGESWRRTHDDPIREVVHTYGYYFGRIAVAPDDPDRIYLTGVPLIRSVDGGKSFTNVLTPDVHVDHHAIWIDPVHPQRILLGNDGGLDLSHDGGDTWLELDGPPVGQFYTVALDDRDPYWIYGGLQDNGTMGGSSRSRPGQDAWTSFGGGDGMFVQIDPRDRTRYLGYQFGFYLRIDPDGTRHDVRPRDAIGEPALRYNWATPILLSPHNADIVYFGANRLFRSMNQGVDWTPISPDLSRRPERGDVPFATITTIGESPLEFGLIWAGTDDGHLHVTEDGGRNWAEVDAALPHSRWISRVEPSRVERGRCYIALNGYRDDDLTPYLYVTEDLGKSWRSITTGLPAEPINVVREDPVVPELLYLGTDRGVYVSLDRGESWRALPDELPNVPVHDLAVHPTERELVAATHGRSVWVIDALPIQELARRANVQPDEPQDGLRIFPVEKVTASRGWRNRRSRWFHREEEDPELVIPFWAAQAGSVELRVLDDADRVLRTLVLDAAPGVQVFEWDLLLDPTLALPAEAARESERVSEGDAEKSDDANEPDDDRPDHGRLARTPWSESHRLGQPLYITAGTYALELRQGESTSRTKLVVEKPEPFEPRVKPAPKIRGEKDDHD